MLDDVAPAQPDGDKVPVLLDLFAGANAPLTKAFMWCGWKAVTPIDLEIDPDFDVTEPGVLPVNRLQTYTHRCRPTQAPCGLQSHETSRVSTHCTLKSKAACLRLFGFRLGEKRCACVFH